MRIRNLLLSLGCAAVLLASPKDSGPARPAAAVPTVRVLASVVWGGCVRLPSWLRLGTARTPSAGKGAER